MEKVEQFMATIVGRRLRSVRRPNGVYYLSFHAQHVVEFFQCLGVGAWQSHEKRVPATILRAPIRSTKLFTGSLVRGPPCRSAGPPPHWQSIHGKTGHRAPS